MLGMDMLHFLVWSLFGIYTLLGAALLFGLWRSRKAVSVDGSRLFSVSIVVAARNEESHLPALLRSFEALDYPRERLQIILVDDRSTDRTYTIMKEWAEKHRGVHVLQVRNLDPRLNGKANALEAGIRRAQGEIIFITDADCQVPPSWIRAHLARYDSKTAMVGGFTLLDRPEAPYPLFSRLQSLDWLYLTAVGSGAAALSMPLSIFGNNWSFRKSCYVAVGGFRRLPFTLVEDLALMHQMRRHKCGRIRLCPDRGMLVISQAAADWSAFLHQRRRWIAGAKQLEWYGIGIMFIGGLGRLVPWGLIALSHLTEGLLMLGLIFILDGLLAIFPSMWLQRRDLLRYLPVYPLFLLAYGLRLLPHLFFRTPVEWKGRKYAGGVLKTEGGERQSKRISR